MRSIAIFAALLACGLPALSQNISQSVQVTNEYETKFADFQKLGVETHVPDSLYEFDYSFDYSVFDSPYRGSYEFTPYEIQLTPDPMAYDGSRFLLRAGAGYSLRPVLDFYWTPVRQGNFTLGLSNVGRGYCGSYEARPAAADGSSALAAFSGYDFSDSFSAGGRYVMKGAEISFGAGYDGIFTGEDIRSSAFSSAWIGARISSSDRTKAYFSYDLGVGYRFSSDLLSPRAPEYGTALLGTTENHLKVDGSLGPVFGNRYAFLLDFSFDLDAVGRPEGYSDLAANFATLTPHVVFSLGVFDLDAGVNLDYLDAATSGFTLAPVAEIGVSMFSGSTRAALGISGGRRLMDVWSLKSFNHFHTSVSGTPAVMRERFGAYAEFGGRIGSRFQYQLRGGYSSLDDLPFEGLRRLDFGSAEFAYAGLDFEWISERLNVDGNVSWQHVLKHATDLDAFAPAELTADFRIEYNWMSRVYAGLSLNAATARSAWVPAVVPPEGQDAGQLQQPAAAPDVPGFADLGIFGEYRFSRRFGAWAELGNLLGMSIERHPGYSIAGPYFSLGLSLRL